MLVRIYAIGLMWMFGPLPSEACDTNPPGCVDLGQPHKWYELPSERAAAPKASERPQPPVSSHLGDQFDSGTPPKPVRTVEIKPDGTIATPRDAR